MSGIFGIEGLTVGSVSTWLTLLVSVPATWFIRGMADRRKAESASKELEDTLVDRQWKRFQDECDRLNVRVNALEGKVETLQNELHTTREERDQALAKIIRLEAYQLGRGEARNAAANEAAEQIGLRLPLEQKGRKDAV